MNFDIDGFYKDLLGLLFSKQSTVSKEECWKCEKDFICTQGLLAFRAALPG